MILDQQRDGSIDLLPHVTGQTLTGHTASRRQFCHALFLEARAQFGLAPAFLPITLVASGEFAMKGPILLPSGGGQKVGNADIHPNERRIFLGLKRNLLIKREGQPPATVAFAQRG